MKTRTKTKRLARAGKRAKAKKALKRTRRHTQKRRRERRHRRKVEAPAPVTKTPHSGNGDAPVGFVPLADAGVKLGDHIRFVTYHQAADAPQPFRPLPFRGIGQVNAVNGLTGAAMLVSVFNAAEGYGETLTGSDFVQKV